MSEPPSRIPSFLRGYPAAVLSLGPDGTVCDSNGKLELRLGRDLVGTPFLDHVDASSSGQKWLRGVASARGVDGHRSELILRAEEGLTAPVTFWVTWDMAEEGIWVIELPADPRLERLSDEVHTINAALNTTQRELSKEKRRLDSALDQLQERQIELARSNRDLQQFAHVISHDLKAPLRSVRSYADFLRQDLKGSLPEEAEGFLDRIIVRAADMDAMINGVLRYARAGQSSSALEQVDVGAMVREIVELHHVGSETRVTIAPDLPVLEADGTQLRQVLQNLISNGLKYGRGENPSLDVTSIASGDFQEITVADNGPGIPEELQDRIWCLFYTTGGTDDDASGSGIGLALVKRLVERNGGSVTLKSEAGKGAAFTVRWPSKAAQSLDHHGS